MMRRFGVLILVVLLCLSGCRKNCVTVGSLEVAQDRAVYMRYELLQGEKEYRVILQEDTALSVETTTKSGTLHLEIAMDSRKPIYTGNISEDFDFTVNIPENGTYQIRVTGQDHSGSYRFSWE